jgi:hypothetical protein
VALAVYAVVIACACATGFYRRDGGATSLSQLGALVQHSSSEILRPPNVVHVEGDGAVAESMDWPTARATAVGPSCTPK